MKITEKNNLVEELRKKLEKAERKRKEKAYKKVKIINSIIYVADIYQDSLDDLIKKDVIVFQFRKGEFHCLDEVLDSVALYGNGNQKTAMNSCIYHKKYMIDCLPDLKNENISSFNVHPLFCQNIRPLTNFVEMKNFYTLLELERIQKELKEKNLTKTI